jgi:PqqD family protein of HPr-rel-A system
LNVSGNGGAPRWHLAPGQLLAHRGWDGEYVLYNDLSGDTHLLAEPALRVLQALQRGPCDEAALDALLATADGAGIDPAALLAGLEALSLIEFDPC